MPTDAETGWAEPDVIINGEPLTFGQCMTLRVAITSFRMGLSVPSMQQALGVDLAAAYDTQCAAIEAAMRRWPR